MLSSLVLGWLYSNVSHAYFRRMVLLSLHEKESPLLEIMVGVEMVGVCTREAAEERITRARHHRTGARTINATMETNVTTILEMKVTWSL